MLGKVVRKFHIRYIYNTEYNYLIFFFVIHIKYLIINELHIDLIVYCNNVLNNF